MSNNDMLKTYSNISKKLLFTKFVTVFIFTSFDIEVLAKCEIYV